MTEGQRKALGKLFGREPRSADVMMTDKALEHIVERRIDGDRLMPQQVVRAAEMALEPRSRASIDPSKSYQNPALINGGLLDPTSGKRYDAELPLGLLDDGGMFLRTVVPRGVRSPKTKGSQK